MMKIAHVKKDNGIHAVPEIQDLRINRKWSLKLDPLLLFPLLLAVWLVGPKILQFYDPVAGSVDQSVWLLVVLALLCFLLVNALCWWLFIYSWQKMGFPSIQSMVSRFDQLSPWQQLSFFLASFALVLLAALGSLNAVL